MKKLFLPAALVIASTTAFAQEYTWDFLRPVARTAFELDFPVKVIVFLLSAAIFAVSYLAYSKNRSKRLLLVSVAFFFFALKWLVKIADVFYSPGDFLSDSSENVFELIILISLLIALFYKGKGKPFGNGAGT